MGPNLSFIDYGIIDLIFFTFHKICEGFVYDEYDMVHKTIQTPVTNQVKVNISIRKFIFTLIVML